MKKRINTESAPAAIGPYSQGIKAGNFIYVSGQIPIVPETGEIAEGDISAQTEQAIKNIKNILEAGGASLKNVIKTTLFLTDMAEFGKVNKTYAEFFTEDPPARVCVEVPKLPKNAKIEIEATAYIE